MPLTPNEVASNFLFIHRCLGNMASGNDYMCHPRCEPGGYDVGVGMMLLNPSQPFQTFDEAKEFALLTMRTIARVVEYERRGAFGKSDGGLYDIEALKELDVFSGRDAYATAEHFIKSRFACPHCGHKGPHKVLAKGFTCAECHVHGPAKNPQIVGGPRRCPYGWLARWAPSLRGVPYKWSAWEKLTDQLLLVIPPAGTVYQLHEAGSVAEALEQTRKYHMLKPVYEINPDYDVLTNAGLDDLRAESVVSGYLTQIEVARSALQHGDLDPRYVDQARVIIERAYEAARPKEPGV